MSKPLALVLLFSPVMLAAQQPMLDVIDRYPVILHEQVSPSCELVRAVELIEYKQFDALALPGSTQEIYSPEFRQGDFVALPSTVSKKVAKSAKKSGFDLRVESTDAARMSAKVMTNGSFCPDPQQAITDANNRRQERRVDLQAQLHRIGSDTSPPVPIEQAQPQSAENQQAAQATEKPKVKEATAMLALVVGIEGKVRDVHVIRSLGLALDQKAIEAVQQWKFLPARMKGLPVPVQINVEVNVHLY
jgi:TonB family protein